MDVASAVSRMKFRMPSIMTATGRPRSRVPDAARRMAAGSRASAST